MKIKKDLKIKRNKNIAGITLIALVITIIVLLILAGISISMLSGDNSILKQAGRAREETERVQIEEALRLAYIDLIGKDILNYSKTASLDDAVTIVQNQGYKDKIKGMPGGAYKLSSENIILSKTAPDNTQEIKLEKDTSTSSGGTWYAVINGKYYKIEENDGDIRIAKEPSNVDPNSGTSGDIINITSSDVTITKVDGKDIAKSDVTAGDTIKVTALNEGSSKITINANGKTYTGDITVVSKIEQAPANLDGALELLAATDTSNQNGKNHELKNVVMTTSNPDVATITTEGIVKCNKVADKEAIISAKKEGETTPRYFKVKSTAKIATNIGSGAPKVPAGFTAIDTKDAKWSTETAETSKGLVIMDSKGNQFVWVPVEHIEDMVMCANNNQTINGNVHHCNIVFDRNNNNISCTAEGNSTEIVGKLYATDTGENFKKNLDTKPYTYTQDSGLREPDAVTTYDNKKTKYTVDDRTTQLVKYKQMAISVAKNGGFYVGRYESSLINRTTRVVAGASSMSAKEDSANMWYGLYAKQNSYASENGVSSSVVSNMIWGSQYDAIMNWIGDSATSKIGNNRNADASRRTGSKPTDKINNIFDLYGLRSEWTMEAYRTNYRVHRGGGYRNSSPSYRSFSDPIVTGDGCSSRPTLYIQ